MNIRFDLLAECYADTLLVEILTGDKVNHQNGIGQVKNTLEKNFKKVKALGIIDDDKSKPTDFETFELISEEAGLKYLERPNTKHGLIMICPAFEKWVFGNAESVGVDPSKYGFGNMKYFKSKCKSQSAGTNIDLKQFLNALKQKKAPSFSLLKKWIEQPPIKKEDADKP